MVDLTKIFFSEREFLVFPHCVIRTHQLTSKNNCRKKVHLLHFLIKHIYHKRRVIGEIPSSILYKWITIVWIQWWNHSHAFTMLLNLSKCEVKAWLCWNLIILPTLIFYVKSNFGDFKWSKNVIFGNFRDSELWIFGTFGTWKLLKFSKIKIQNL